eukprot:1144170-Pelagomonas_calceolata.AAC.8
MKHNNILPTHTQSTPRTRVALGLLIQHSSSLAIWAYVRRCASASSRVVGDLTNQDTSPRFCAAGRMSNHQMRESRCWTYVRCCALASSCACLRVLQKEIASRTSYQTYQVRCRQMKGLPQFGDAWLKSPRLGSRGGHMASVACAVHIARALCRGQCQPRMLCAASLAQWHCRLSRICGTAALAGYARAHSQGAKVPPGCT